MLLYGIIATKKYIGDIRTSVDNSNIWYEQEGEFEPETFVQICQAAANANIQILILDISCAEDVSIVRGLQQFRLLRDSRIIILAPGRIPGDPMISNLISLQVLDIVAPIIDEEEEEGDPTSFVLLIKQQLAMKASYGNVVRWDVKTTSNILNANAAAKIQTPKVNKMKAPKTEEIDEGLLEHLETLDFNSFHKREKVIIQDRSIGAVVIAFAGAVRRAGTTFAAMQAAVYLAQQQKKVALIELLKEADSEMGFYQTEERIKDGFVFQGIHCFPSADSEIFTKVFMNDFQYIIIDFGELLQFDEGRTQPTIFLKEFAQADLHFLTMGSSLKDHSAAFKTLDFLFTKEWNRPLHFLVNFTTSKSFQEIQKGLTKEESKLLNVMFHQMALRSNPLERQDDWAELLESVLMKPKKKRFWRGD